MIVEWRIKKGKQKKKIWRREEDPWGFPWREAQWRRTDTQKEV